ncbi:MAG: hypothetical protein L7U72_01870, partial [Rubripirellula sp.]|nr:hypothetical protein [Rubripirellula sp.]
MAPPRWLRQGRLLAVAMQSQTQANDPTKKSGPITPMIRCQFGKITLAANIYALFTNELSACPWVKILWRIYM